MIERVDQLSPAEFVRRRQQDRPKNIPDERYFSSYLRERLQEQPDLAARVKLENREDYALRILAQLKPRLSEAFVSVLETDAVAIGEVDDPRPNACCQPLGPGRFAITFNTGLAHFNYRVVRAFATRFVAAGETCPEPVSFQDTCRIIGDIFLWLNETGSAYGPEYSITHGQILMANVLTFEVNCFFLAHELAHGAIHLGYGEYPDEVVEGRASEEEYLADAIAFGVLLSRPERSVDTPEIAVSYAAMELALMIWQGLEQFGIEFEGTHPSAAERLSALRRLLAETFPDPAAVRAITAFSEPMRIVFESVLDETRAPNYEAFVDRAATELMSKLDALLTSCTGGDVPDYSRFYEEANHFFDHGISLKLTQRMAAVAADWFEKMERLSDEQDRQETHEIWVAFQKYKLFFGYIQQLPPSPREAFERALGLVRGA